MSDTISAVHGCGRLVMADVSTLDEGLAALVSGADIVGTTLAGYTDRSPAAHGPDLGVVASLRAAAPDAVLIAEGRIRTPQLAADALVAGATAVVVGAAITDARWIAAAFAAAIDVRPVDDDPPRPGPSHRDDLLCDRERCVQIQHSIGDRLMSTEGTPVRLRTAHWYAGRNRDSFFHRSWMKRGLPDDAFTGRPMIGICNSASELAPCNQHLDELAEHVKRGVWEWGGVPLEFPVMSLGETQIQPTAMLLRNLMAMDVEESIRGNPIDGVVLLAGCDKTTPAMVMGAASVDLPAIMVTGGPMLTGRHEGRGWFGHRHLADERGGARRHAQRGRVPRHRVDHDPQRRALQPDGNGLDDGVDGRSARLHLARQRRDPCPRRPPPPTRPPLWPADRRNGARRPQAVGGTDPRRFENAIRVLAAIGGSSNAVIHLLAIAGRVGVDLNLDDFDRIGSHLPLLANVMPAGEFLMEDFFEAGGIPAVMAELAELLDGDALTVTGAPIREHWAGRTTWNRKVIRSLADPLIPEAGLAVLRGNLCPQGAVVKPSAACPRSSRTPARPRLRHDRGLQGAHRRSRAGRHRRHRDGAARVRTDAAIPGCRRSATCRCPPSSSPKASSTWCGSATPG